MPRQNQGKGRGQHPLGVQRGPARVGSLEPTVQAESGEVARVRGRSPCQDRVLTWVWPLGQGPWKGRDLPVEAGRPHQFAQYLQRAPLSLFLWKKRVTHTMDWVWPGGGWWG